MEIRKISPCEGLFSPGTGCPRAGVALGDMVWCWPWQCWVNGVDVALGELAGFSSRTILCLCDALGPSRQGRHGGKDGTGGILWQRPGDQCPAGKERPASVRSFPVIPQLPAWLKSSPSPKVTRPSPQRAAPHSCSAGSCPTASRVCKNSSGAGATMCSAS